MTQEEIENEGYKVEVFKNTEKFTLDFFGSLKEVQRIMKGKLQSSEIDNFLIYEMKTWRKFNKDKK